MPNITIQITDEQVATIVASLTGGTNVPGPSPVEQEQAALEELANDEIVDNIIPRDTAPFVNSGDTAPVHSIVPNQDGVQHDPSEIKLFTPSDGMDKHGIPWHPEHHSGVKKLTIKGYWKRIRGGDRSACSKYEAQYTNPPVEEITPTNPLNPPTDEVPVFEIPEAMGNAVVEDIGPSNIEPPVNVLQEVVAEGMAVPTMLPMPTAIPVAEPVTYEALLEAFAEAGKRIGEDEVLQRVGAIYAEVGVKAPGDLLTDETLRAGVYERLVAL